MVKNIIIIGLALVVYSNKIAKDHSEMVRETMLQESVDTLEDMYEWMEWDILNDKVDKEIGEIYLVHVEDLIEQL